MIKSSTAATLTTVPNTIERFSPLSDFPLDVGEGGCTCDVMVCTGVVVQESISVDACKAVYVDVTNIFVDIVASEQEVADGSYAGILSNDPT